MSCVETEQTETEANCNLLSPAVTLCTAIPSNRQISAAFIWEKPQYRRFIAAGNLQSTYTYSPHSEEYTASIWWRLYLHLFLFFLWKNKKSDLKRSCADFQKKTRSAVCVFPWLWGKFLKKINPYKCHQVLSGVGNYTFKNRNLELYTGVEFERRHWVALWRVEAPVFFKDWTSDICADFSIWLFISSPIVLKWKVVQSLDSPFLKGEIHNTIHPLRAHNIQEWII